MTPKEKAKELVDRFIVNSNQNAYRHSKQCALICVDEILKLHMWKHNSVDLYKYWQEVKQEIEKYG